MPAKKLKRIIVTKQCKNCNKDFDVTRAGLKPRKKEQTCCSVHCARSLATKQKRELINKKVSKKLKILFDNRGRKGKKSYNCIECQRPIGYTKYGYCVSCFKKTSICHQSLSNGIKRSVQEGRHKGWITRKHHTSFAEAFFEKVLNVKGLKDQYIREFRFDKQKFMNKSGCWFLDFYFPKQKIDLEIDGSQHERQESKIQDQKRDKTLTQHGFKVYRIKWKDLRSKENKLYMKQEIAKFLDFFGHIAQLDRVAAS